MSLEEILKIGNEGAPKEWLDCFTGEGIGNGFEGIDGDVLDEIMNEDDSDDPLMPNLPIEATPEIQFYQCSSKNYTKGRGGSSITHIVVHYTSGSKTSEGAALANCKYFGRTSAGASAHYFIDSGYTIWQSVSESDTAWHAGNWAMNRRSIGIEVCSAGAFTEAEIERLAWLVQKLMKKYGIPSSRVIRHYDVTKKQCPAYYVNASRWRALHSRITSGTISSGSTATTSKKSVDAIAKEVIAGKWGNGDARKTALTKAGYDYAAIQKRVNELLSANTSNKKSVDAIAKEVIAGKWGNGTDRKNRLTKAGYNYSAVQKRVNELL